MNYAFGVSVNFSSPPPAPPAPPSLSLLECCVLVVRHAIGLAQVLPRLP